MAEKITSHKDLRVYQQAIDGAMAVFKLTVKFPVEERFSMVDQIRRSSRSVCANIGEAWRKRRYRAAFIAKLNDAEGEAAETQIWLDLAQRCCYVSSSEATVLEKTYDNVIGQLVTMSRQADKWTI